jgi:hypothetical protein
MTSAELAAIVASGVVIFLFLIGLVRGGHTR